jgi:hypothetical protein
LLALRFSLTYLCGSADLGEGSMGLKVPVFMFRTLPVLLHSYAESKAFHCCVWFCGHGQAGNGGQHIINLHCAWMHHTLGDCR